MLEHQAGKLGDSNDDDVEAMHAIDSILPILAYQSPNTNEEKSGKIWIADINLPFDRWNRPEKLKRAAQKAAACKLPSPCLRVGYLFW